MSLQDTKRSLSGEKTKKPHLPKRPRKRPPEAPDDLGRPEPTEEVVGDEVVSDWSYDPLKTPPPQKRATPLHRQRNMATPHAF